MLEQTVAKAAELIERSEQPLTIIALNQGFAGSEPLFAQLLRLGGAHTQSISSRASLIICPSWQDSLAIPAR